MSYIHIESESDASALERDLSSGERIALDCEAAGFHRYSDQLCLVQVSTVTATYVVDPLAFDPSQLLREALRDHGVEERRLCGVDEHLLQVRRQPL